MDKPLKLLFAALCCVNHNQVNYGPGQPGGLVLELTAEEAQPLLDVGAIKPQTQDAAEPPAGVAVPAAKKR